MTENNNSIKKDAPIEKVTEIPHNIDIEVSLLGAILRDNYSYERISFDLTLLPEHFYAPQHSLIFSWVQKTIDGGLLATPTSLGHYADSNETIKQLGGRDYLNTLASSLITVVNVVEYAKTVIDLYTKRELIHIGEDIIDDAKTAEIENTAELQLEKAEQSLYSLAEKGDSSNKISHLSTALDIVIKDTEEAIKSPGNLRGYTTGLADLDEHIGGLQKSDLLILAGRPAMGKTALATNIAFNIAKAKIQNDETSKNGGAVLFVSLEMSAEQLASRILSEQSEIKSDKINRGKIDEEEFTKLITASNDLSKIPLYIEDTPALSITALRQRARRHLRKNGLDVIFVDYLQLLSGPAGKKMDNRVHEISEITRGLKILAKELNVPIIALSQLSRKLEERQDKTPILSDLRESGSIEQDADLVLFIHRPEYYLKNTDTLEKSDKETNEHYEKRVIEHTKEMNETRGLAKVIVAKHRHGPVGTVGLHFNADLTKFSNLDKNH